MEQLLSFTYLYILQYFQPDLLIPVTAYQALHFSRDARLAD
jgi:hypothetical protein